MVEPGVPADETSTAVARSQAVPRSCTQLTGSRDKLASPVQRALALEARAYVIWGVFWLVEEVPRAN